MYIKLSDYGFPFLSNDFIYDSSDKSVEWITVGEYNSIAHLVSNDYKSLSLQTGVLSRLLMSGSNFRLFKNAFIDFFIVYYDNCWCLCINLLKGNIFLVQSGGTFNYLSSVLWDSALSRNTYMRIPSLYAEYLINNDKGRIKQVNRLLSYVDFKLTDRTGLEHYVKGVDELSEIQVL